MSHRKCAFHTQCHQYTRGADKHDQLFDLTDPSSGQEDMVMIKLVFHFLAPSGSYNTQRVASRAYDITLSLNDDFNNYSGNPNLMNNFRYKSIVNQVFTNNMAKQSVYLGPEYMRYVPTVPSNITFECGEIYYYPIKTRLSLSQYNDETDVETEYQVIKNYIYRNRAAAILPENFLNIWVIDTTGTEILGFSSFPWDDNHEFDGVMIHRRVFFPEDYEETAYDRYKTVTHQVGHYLGLMHIFNHATSTATRLSGNANLENTGESEPILPKLRNTFNPVKDKILQSNENYNPLFMNPMSYTIDRYITNFTPKQISEMRYTLSVYRSKLNALKHNIRLPKSAYVPEREAPVTRQTKPVSRRPIPRSRQDLSHLAPEPQPSSVPDNSPQAAYREYYQQTPEPQPVPIAPVQNTAQPLIAHNLMGGDMGMAEHNPDETILRNIMESMSRSDYLTPHPPMPAQSGLSEKLNRVTTELKALKTELADAPKYNKYNQVMTPPEPSSNMTNRFIRSKPVSR